MNLIALETLNAYITLELCALTAIAYHKANNMQLVSYKPLFKKLVESVHVFFHDVFGLYCTVYDDVQTIDLELPIMSEIVSAYCVLHVRNNTLIECAGFERAKTVCDSMGLGYSVICKYWIDGQTVYDNQVYRASQEVYMDLENMRKALHMLSRDDQDWYTLTNLISDITEGYLSYSHKPNKFYKVKVYIKAVSFYGYDDPMFDCLKVKPLFSMMVLYLKLIYILKALTVIIVSIDNWESINYPYDPIMNLKNFFRYKFFRGFENSRMFHFIEGI